MNDKLHAIILAGGRGTRMHSDLPKCAFPVCGKPMIKYITDTCKECGIDDICVIVGYKSEILIDCLDKDVRYAKQEEQLGTGHACMCAKPLLKDCDGLTIIFPGDMPLIETKTVKSMIEQHTNNGNALTVLTTVLDDPKQYGRIYRENGNVKRIIEFKDCNDEQKKINEINVAVYCVDNKLLFSTLDKIKNNNNAHEYYLTDIVEILGKDYKVDSYIANNDYHLIAPNDVETLNKLEEEFMKHKYN